MGGGYGQHIQKHGHSGHVLASPGEGGDLPLCTFDHYSLACLKHQFALVQVSQSGLNDRPFIGELASWPHNFAFDVVLQSMPSFLLVSHRLLKEGPGVWSRFGTPLRRRWYHLKC
jgi:hypothetical protein